MVILGVQGALSRQERALSYPRFDGHLEGGTSPEEV